MAQSVGPSLSCALQNKELILVCEVPSIPARMFPEPHNESRGSQPPRLALASAQQCDRGTCHIPPALAPGCGETAPSCQGKDFLHPMKTEAR